MAMAMAMSLTCTSLQPRPHAGPATSGRRIAACSAGGSQRSSFEGTALSFPAGLAARRRVFTARHAIIRADMDFATLGLEAAGVLGVGYAGVRAFVYFRLQYITAAMLGNNTPRGGSRVVELGIGKGRNLYYYPPDTVLVTGVDPGASEGLLSEIAVQAKVPVAVKTGKLEKVDVPSASADAVVSTGAFASGLASDRTACLQEVVRMLKPGRPFIFVEPLSGGGAGIVEAIKNTAGLDTPQVDAEWASNPVAPTAIGIAIRTGEQGFQRKGSGSAADSPPLAAEGLGKKGKKKGGK